MSLQKKKTRENLNKVFEDISSTANYNLDQHVPSNVGNVFKMGIINEISLELQKTQEYLRTPIGMDMLLGKVYQNRIISVRIALLLWCQVSVIKEYSNNNNDDIRIMIEHIVKSMRSYIYYPLLCKDQYKSCIIKIQSTLKKLITNSINQIRNSGQSNECKSEYKKCFTFFEDNLDATVESEELDNLVLLYLKSCKINPNSNDVRMNKRLYRKAYNSVRQWLYAQLTITDSTNISSQLLIPNSQKTIVDASSF